MTEDKEESQSVVGGKAMNSLYNNTNKHIGELMTTRKTLQEGVKDNPTLSQDVAIIEMQIDEARRFYKNPLKD